MKDASRQPTRLDRLREITQRLLACRDGMEGEPLDDEQANDELAWLEWTLNFLETRKLYHKKTRIKTVMLERMARTLLSKDELEAIDRQAEEQLSVEAIQLLKPETEEELINESEEVPPDAG